MLVEKQQLKCSETIYCIYVMFLFMLYVVLLHVCSYSDQLSLKLAHELRVNMNQAPGLIVHKLLHRKNYLNIIHWGVIGTHLSVR